MFVLFTYPHIFQGYFPLQNIKYGILIRNADIAQNSEKLGKILLFGNFLFIKTYPDLDTKLIKEIN